MALSSVKASTQDSTSGTPVATVANRDAGGNAIQVVALVGLKEDEPSLSRTGIAADDTATTDLSTVGFGSSGLGDVGNALAVALRASCSVAGATLRGRLVIYDSSSAPLGFNEQVTFTSDATRRLSATGDYACERVIQDLGRACKVKFYVESVSGGTWTVDCRPV